MATEALDPSSPNDTPSCRFAVLCHQRSGSNALSSALQQHPDVALYGQLFNSSFEYRRYHRDMLAMPLFARHPEALRHFGLRPPLRRRVEDATLRLVRRSQGVEQYVEQYVEQFFDAFGTEARAVGFKLHDFQVGDDDLLALLGRLDRVLVMHRRNLLQAAVSWAVAVQTGLWVRKSDARSDRAIELDIDELRWFIDKTRRSLQTWGELVDRSGVDAMWLEFETTMTTTDGSPADLSAIVDFLGLDPDVDIAPTTRRLATPDYAHVRNAREIDRELGDDDTGRLFAR